MKYKLVTRDYKTRKGHHNEMTWAIGQTNYATGEGDELCTDGVLHYYDSPEAAAAYNCIHGDIDDAVLLEVKGRSVRFDGLKGGAKSLTAIREMELPVISVEARVRFAIYAAQGVGVTSEAWNKWAIKWLDGSNRSAEAARVAEEATWAAAWAAAKAAAKAAAVAEAAAVAVALAAKAAWAATPIPDINFTKLLRKAIRDEAKFQEAQCSN